MTITDPKVIPDGFHPIKSSNNFGSRNGPLFEKKNADGTWVRGFTVSENHSNQANVLHGGMLMTFADIVLARAIMDVFDPPFVTVRLTTDFISPALQGTWVEGTAKVTGEQNELVTVQGQFTSRKKVIGTATAVFKLLRSRKKNKE